MNDPSHDSAPYAPGTILSVYPHRPPSLEKANEQITNEREERFIREGRRCEAVFENSANTAIHTADQTTPYELKITKNLAGGWKHGAQVALCNVSLSNQTPNTEYVVKIFDPLYYREPELRLPWYPPASLTKQANIEYATEAKAYKLIKSRSAPSNCLSLCTPKYYESWCFELSEEDTVPPPGDAAHPKSAQTQDETPHSPQRRRFVCCILLEHVRGRTMRQLVTDPANGAVHEHWFQRFDETCRLYVWAQLLEADAWLRHIGVYHGDLEHRNIMVAPAPEINDSSPEATSLRPRLVIIDFNFAVFENPAATELPENPIVEWWSQYSHSSHTWCPTWWVGDTVKRRRWLVGVFGAGGEKAARFAELGDMGDITAVTPREIESMKRFKAIQEDISTYHLSITEADERWHYRSGKETSS